MNIIVNFTARSVIVPNAKLRLDQVTLPYAACVELLQQSIVNLLQKSYNMSYSDAFKVWYRAQIIKDDIVYKIILGLIHDAPMGIPILINRNPTIAYGGILQMFVVDITDAYVLGVPLGILNLLAADFDGDVLNILYIINKQFYEAAFRILNPRNAMMISRNDGKFNQAVNHSKDILINCNSFIQLSRKSYSQEQITKIIRLKAKV